MKSRQIISAFLAALVIVLNVAVWNWLRGPSKELPDPRANIAKLRMKSWEAMDAAPLADIEEYLKQRFGVEDGSSNKQQTVLVMTEDGPREVMVRTTFLQAFNSEEKIDLYKAISGAIDAIQTNRPIPLLNYMKGRDLKLDPSLLTEKFPELSKEANASLKQKPHRQLESYWQSAAINAHWKAWLPTATDIRAQYVSKMHEISLVQLGETESWLWNNQSLHKTIFTGDQFIELALYKKQKVIVADVSFVVVLDDAYNNSLCPCYLRFWKSDRQDKWQPYALKVVYSEVRDDISMPAIIF